MQRDNPLGSATHSCTHSAHSLTLSHWHNRFGAYAARVRTSEVRAVSNKLAAHCLPVGNDSLGPSDSAAKLSSLNPFVAKNVVVCTTHHTHTTHTQWTHPRPIYCTLHLTRATRTSHAQTRVLCSKVTHTNCLFVCVCNATGEGQGRSKAVPILCLVCTQFALTQLLRLLNH